MVLAPILEGLGKEFIGRPRPVGDALGFPSGHVTAASTYFFLAAYLIGKRLNAPQRNLLWVSAAIIVVLVGLARIVLRAHWPADFLGGATLGLALASAAFWWHESRG
ncbi:MAG TPA: phosphatase PAP2 family protein [Methylomirabilota bacterium]|nr:phosphatase PAP2 family protein [Methylomirabilota bacterium]